MNELSANARKLLVAIGNECMKKRENRKNISAHQPNINMTRDEFFAAYHELSGELLLSNGQHDILDESGDVENPGVILKNPGLTKHGEDVFRQLQKN